MQPNRTHGFTLEQLERMCQGKHRWSDEHAARAGGLQSLERRPQTRKLYTYHCPACRGWHLTRSWVKGQKPITLDPEACHARTSKAG